MYNIFCIFDLEHNINHKNFDSLKKNQLNKKDIQIHLVLCNMKYGIPCIYDLNPHYFHNL